MAQRRRRGRSGGKRARRGARGQRRALARTLTATVLVIVVAAMAGVAWLLLVYPHGAHPGAGERVALELEPGVELGAIADRLAAEGVVDHPRVFAAYAQLRGAGDRLREGNVVLSDDLPPVDVLRRVAKGYGETRVRIVVPEGWTRFELAERLEHWAVCDADEFVRVTRDPDVLAALAVDGPSLEGYLFPATYSLPQHAPPREVAQKMVQTWRKRVMPLLEEHPDGMAALRSDFHWGVHEVLTLASIVEKEAVVPREQPVIAGVFLNRLRDPGFEPKRLQADPTAAYGCLLPDPAPSCDGYDGTITRTMLRDGDNAYNTYRLEGLPPGPIASPGVGAIRAVLDPAEHDYLYFVASGEGRHDFSATHEEHVEAVARYREGGRDEEGSQ